MLLTERGKDEVGVRNGKKVALGLSALGRTLAPDPAGTDGNLRLQQLIACAAGVVVGIDEAGKPCFLVGFEQFAAAPCAAHQHQPAGGQNQCLAEVDAAQEKPRY